MTYEFEVGMHTVKLSHDSFRVMFDKKLFCASDMAKKFYKDIKDFKKNHKRVPVVTIDSGDCWISLTYADVFSGWLCDEYENTVKTMIDEAFSQEDQDNTQLTVVDDVRSIDKIADSKTNLQVFNNPIFGDIRVVFVNGNPWFVAKDVCDKLELTNTSKTLERVDLDDITESYVTDSLGRKQLTKIVNESGLYSIIFQSVKPEAKDFKKWVTSEVIPAIRKTGKYSLTPEQSKAELTLQVINLLQDEIAHYKSLNEELKPKADSYDMITESAGSLNIGNYAKLISRCNNIEVSQNDVFEWLRKNKYVQIGRDDGERNVAYQKYISKGWFELKHEIKNNKSYPVTQITGIGQVELTEKIVSAFKNGEIW